MDSDIHNRRWMHVVVIATAFMFLGAACSRKETPAAPSAASAPQPAADAGTTTSTTTMPTEWAEHRNAEFGVVIPYPKGWAVKQQRDDGGLQILIDPGTSSALEQGSDAPAWVVVWISQASLEDALRVYGAAIRRSEVTFGSRRVVVVDYKSELGASLQKPEPRKAYHWVDGEGRLYTVDGIRGDAVLDYVVANIKPIGR